MWHHQRKFILESVFSLLFYQKQKQIIGNKLFLIIIFPTSMFITSERSKCQKKLDTKSKMGTINWLTKTPQNPA